LWLSGALIFYQEWDGQWSGRGTLATTNYLAAQYRVGLDKAALDARGAGNSYSKHTLSVGELEEKMRGGISETHLLAGLIAFGPSFRLIPGASPVHDAALARESAFFSGLSAELRSGVNRSLGRRLAMYINAGWGTLWSLLGIRASGEGYTMEENVLGLAEHCEGSGSCVEVTAKGKVPIGTLLPIGTRLCLTSCKCTIAYS
jgi:hypothetical protein